MKLILLMVLMSGCAGLGQGIKTAEYVGKAVIKEGAREGGEAVVRQEVAPIRTQLTSVEYLIKRVGGDTIALAADQKIANRETKKEISALRRDVRSLEKTATRNQARTDRDVVKLRKDYNALVAEFSVLKKMVLAKI